MRIRYELFVLYFILLCDTSNSFVNLYVPHRQQLCLYCHKNNQNQNKSKIFKLDFSEIMDDDKLFRQRHIFGLSDFDLAMFRLYLNLVAIFQILYIFFDHN